MKSFKGIEHQSKIVNPIKEVTKVNAFTNMMGGGRKAANKSITDLIDEVSNHELDLSELEKATLDEPQSSRDSGDLHGDQNDKGKNFKKKRL